MDFTVLPGFVIASLLLVAVPGPSTLYVVTQVKLGGPRAALALAGVVSGDLVLALLAATGAAVAIQAIPAIAVGLEAIGALYIGWIGLGFLMRSEGANGGISKQGSPVFLGGFAVAASNPKVMLTFVAFLPLFLGEADFRNQQMIMLSLTFEIVNAIYLSALVYAIRVLSGAGMFQHVMDSNARLISGVGLIIMSVITFGRIMMLYAPMAF
jgi:threonine/homoserine/homoserine lactone efflux protein